MNYKSYVEGNKLRIGRDFRIGKNSRIVGESIVIGNHVHIGNNTQIFSESVRIGDYSNVGKDVKALCLDFDLGKSVNIGSRSRIENLGRFKVGDETYITSDVWMEASLYRSINSYLDIGIRNLICSGTRINVEEPVNIGNYVGIGQNVDIWTHGFHPDRLLGFPGGFGPVKIGDRVWLIARSTVLQGVSIGNNTVIGTGSLVNRDVPEGSFAAGMPLKVIKEGAYPSRLSYEQKRNILSSSLDRYKSIKESKGIKSEISLKGTNIIFRKGIEELIFDENTRNVFGPDGNPTSDLSLDAEDLRDFLRSQGIGYWTGKPFKSKVPLNFEKLLNMAEEK